MDRGWPRRILSRLSRYGPNWSEITIHVHGDMTLKQAIGHVLGDTKFWQVELFSKEHCSPTTFAVAPTSWQGGSVWTKGKGKNSNDSQKGNTSWCHNQNPKSKGRPEANWSSLDTQNDKSAKKGYTHAFSDFAAVDAAFSNGKEFCMKHQKGWCNLSAWQTESWSRACPKVLQSTGEPYGGGHRRVFCPNLRRSTPSPPAVWAAEDDIFDGTLTVPN